jgi:hypothetical protein
LKILVIVTHYFPSQVVGALRWDRLVRDLANRHDVVIVKENEEKCQGVQRDEAEGNAKVYQVSPPVNRFESSIQLLGEKLTNKQSVLSKVLRKFIELSQFPHASWAWGRKVRDDLLSSDIDLNFDIIVASHPQIGCLRAASMLSRGLGVPWVADMRDPISEYQFYVSSWQKCFKPFLKFIENKLLSSSNAVVGINHELLEILYYPKGHEKHAIANSYDPDEYECNELCKKITITYTGSITPFTDSRIFICGLERLISDRPTAVDELQVVYFGSDYHFLTDSAVTDEVKSMLINNGSTPRTEVLKALSSSDLLLGFGWNGKHAEILDSGKTYDYLGSMKPVMVTAKTYRPKMSRIIRDTGAGIVVHNEHEVAKVLKSLIIDRKSFKDDFVKLRAEKDDGRYELKRQAACYERVLTHIVNR